MNINSKRRHRRSGHFYQTLQIPTRTSI